MPWYCVEIIDQQCVGLGSIPCSRKATWEVRNERNELIGRRCRLCARELVRRQNQEQHDAK